MRFHMVPEEWFGHQPDVQEVVTYRCASCGRGLDKQDDGTFRHNEQDRDYDAYAREERQRAKATTLASATAYHGAIKQCQAMVMPSERGPIEYRCRKRAAFVVSREPRSMGSTSAKVDRIAVCRVHAEDSRSRRFFEKRWGGKYDTPMRGDALEQVEKEYR